MVFDTDSPDERRDAGEMEREFREYTRKQETRPDPAEAEQKPTVAESATVRDAPDPTEKERTLAERIFDACYEASGLIVKRQRALLVSVIRRMLVEDAARRGEREKAKDQQIADLLALIQREFSAREAEKPEPDEAAIRLECATIASSECENWKNLSDNGAPVPHAARIAGIAAASNICSKILLGGTSRDVPPERAPAVDCPNLKQ